MKTIIIKSLIIAIVLGLVFSVVLNTLSATYAVKDSVSGTEIFLTGMDAVKALIRNFGLTSFIQMLIGYFSIFFLAVFTGCLWFNKWHHKN